jgi:hypothetical protein
LAESLLASPYACVNDLQEQLTGAGVEDEDRAVYRLGCQVAFKRLVDGDSVYVRVVDEEFDVVGKEL